MQTRTLELREKNFEPAAARAIADAIEVEIEARKDTLSTKLDLGDLKVELKADIAESKAEVVRWIFIFWIGTVFSMAGVSFGAMYFLLSRLKP